LCLGARREALFKAGLEFLAVQAAADEDHFGDAFLVFLPRIRRRPEVDGFVHPLKDKLGVALASKG